MKTNDQFTPLGQTKEDIDSRISRLGLTAFSLYNGANAGVSQPTFGEGIRQIVKNSTGNYTFVFKEVKPNANYLVIALPESNRVLKVTNKKVGSFDIVAVDFSFAAADTTVDVIVLGA